MMDTAPSHTGDNPDQARMSSRRRRHRVWLWFGMALVLLVVGVLGFVKTHPLIFNESFWGHQHCILQTGVALHMYAEENQGRFPVHTNGYADALLLLTDYLGDDTRTLTGPGYDPELLRDFKRAGGDVPERSCGRVYVQNLTTSSDPGIAIFFDKLSTPGGDHGNGLGRLRHPLLREVLFVDGSRELITDSAWLDFVQQQTQKLVDAGFDQSEATELYAQTTTTR